MRSVSVLEPPRLCYPPPWPHGMIRSNVKKLRQAHRSDSMQAYPDSAVYIHWLLWGFSRDYMIVIHVRVVCFPRSMSSPTGSLRRFSLMFVPGTGGEWTCSHKRWSLPYSYLTELQRAPIRTGATVDEVHSSIHRGMNFVVVKLKTVREEALYCIQLYTNTFVMENRANRSHKS